MTTSGYEAAVDRLHAVALEDFVTERARLAKELRAGGDRPAAAQLAKLAKPTPPAWALNHVAREEPEALAAWLEAAAALREASVQAREVGGDALRAAMGEHRSATTRLVALVRERAQPGGRPLSAPMLDRVRGLLQAATVDPEQAERLRAGRIGEEAAGEPELAVDPAPEPAPAPKRREAKPERARTKADRAAEQECVKAERAAEQERAKAERAAEQERAKAERAAEQKRAKAERAAERERALRAAKEEARRLREEATRRAQAARAAEERVEEARRALERAQSEAAIAREAAAEGEEAASAAEDELGG